MRIIYVVHAFLPYSATGVENYTYNIAKEFGKRHEVLVYTSVFNPSEERFKRFSYEYDGIRVEAFYHDSVYRDFSETYLNPVLDRNFDEVVVSFGPDLVHFQHLMFHSTGYLGVLQRHNIPAVLTLQDFYYYCPNLGQRLFLGKYNCNEKSPIKCSLCYRTSSINISAVDRIIYNKVKDKSLFVNISKRFPEIAYLVKLVRLLKKGPDPHQIEEREQVMLKCLSEFSVIISPSEYYRRFYERYTGHKRIVHLDYGFNKEVEVVKEVRSKGVLNIGYIGTISRHKGANILISLANRFRGRVRILVWGNDKNDLILSKRLKSTSGVEYRGEFSPEKRGDVFREMDYLIVPSIWEENSPLAIHEALIYNTPVIASKRGGNSELIVEGKNGFLFDPEDLNSLYRLIDRIIRERIYFDRVDSFNVISIGDHIKILEEIYKGRF